MNPDRKNWDITPEKDKPVYENWEKDRPWTGGYEGKGSPGEFPIGGTGEVDPLVKQCEGLSEKIRWMDKLDELEDKLIDQYLTPSFAYHDCSEEEIRPRIKLIRELREWREEEVLEEEVLEDD